LVKPSKDWKDEQWNDFFSKAGRPENPDGYQLEVKDGKYTPESITEFKQIAHKAGLLPNQVKAVMSFYETIQAKQGDAMQQADIAQRQAAERELKDEWGGQFEQKLNTAKKFVNTFADEKDKEALFGKLGDDPMMLRILANAASVMRDDALLGTESDGNPNTSSLQQELDKIVQNPLYFDPSESRKFRQEHDRLVARALHIRKALTR
jgi:hypothetical protein